MGSDRDDYRQWVNNDLRDRLNEITYSMWPAHDDTVRAGDA